jgi:PRC-barrel domain protein
MFHTAHLASIISIGAAALSVGATIVPPQLTIPQAVAFVQAPDSESTTQPAESVLGIEVHTNSEKNIGRIIDVLAGRRGGIEAVVVEFGGFLGIGTRKVAIEWSALRLESEGNQLIAVLNIPRDQLRAAPEYKQGQPAVITRAIDPLSPSP